MLQDTINKLYTASIGDKGTLSQIKSSFNHRGVTTDVMNSFNHVDNFMKFTTEAHVVYLAMQLCGMEKLEDKPHGEIQLYELCQKVVNEIWILPSASDVQTIIEAEADLSNDIWCTCQKCIFKNNFIRVVSETV